MGVALPIIAIAGAAISAVGMVQQGQAQKSAANYQAQVAANNAQIAQQNARQSAARGEEMATEQGMKNRQQLGAIGAAMAANGVDVNSGSAADVKSSQRLVGNLDTELIRSNAAREVYGYKTQGTSYQAESQLDTFQGKNAETGADIGAVGSLLGNAGEIGMKYSNMGNSNNSLVS